MPPTEVTNRELAGWITPKPPSPLLAVMATPGLLRWIWSNPSCPGDSAPPQLFEMYFAPIRAAVSIAVNSELSGTFDSTSRILHSGQIAEAMSMSSAISPAQPASARGSGLAAPFWLTFRKQPLAVVHGGRPNWARYTARSASAFGSSNASMMATVAPLPAVAEGSLYALCRSAGPSPAGAAWGASIGCTVSVCISARQAYRPGTVGTSPHTFRVGWPGGAAAGFTDACAATTAPPRPTVPRQTAASRDTAVLRRTGDTSEWADVATSQEVAIDVCQAPMLAHGNATRIR